MRFYGIPSEDRVLEIIETIDGESWLYVDTVQNKKEELSKEKAKEKLKEILREVVAWKKGNRHIPPSTPFFFVYEPSNPKAFKIYDLSSLGCSTNLSPPRWVVCLKDLEGNLGI